LAERMVSEFKDPAGRIRYGFQLATARKPASRELQALRELARQETLEYRKDPAKASKLLAIGESKIPASLVRNEMDRSELAAWTTVASTILNLDETVTKE
jgi:hypothetical protein